MESQKSKEAGYYPVGINVGGEKGQLLQQPSVHVDAYQPATEVQPPDYLGWSLVNLLCCFWPLGLVALIKSIDVRSHHAGGRYREAEVASKSARLLNKIGFAIGCTIAALAIILSLFAITARIVIAAHGGGNHTGWHHGHHHGPMHG